MNMTKERLYEDDLDELLDDAIKDFQEPSKQGDQSLYKFYCTIFKNYLPEFSFPKSTLWTGDFNGDSKIQWNSVVFVTLFR